ncbi:MAG: SPOR domain-containing protein [Lewinellaceae bacterium]|nr:SPOR domain-containing protein [Lewinellaceae bacterium]
MNTNKLLTYLLYALLGGLILVAGYKVWENKQRSTRLAKEDAEFRQSMRDLGYVEPDTTGSQYDGDEPAGATTPPAPGSSSVVTADGIEEETPTAATPTPQQPAAKPAPKTTTPTPAAPAPRTEEPRNLDTDNSDGRYRVIAGSFTKLAGARREMERIIKMGYQDAEVGLYNRGKFAVVIVKRTNNLNEAIRIQEALERKGVDASVVDRERRK